MRLAKTEQRNLLTVTRLTHTTSDWLFFRGMDFANNHYGRELARSLLSESGDRFEQRLFDSAERFVRAGLACSIANYGSARPYGVEDPRYLQESRCGRP